MARRDDGEGRFGLGWALAAAIAVHLVAVLIAPLLPLRGATATPVPEESVLRFRFTEPDAVRDVQRRGDVPFEIPRASPTPAPRPAEPVPPAATPRPPAAQPLPAPAGVPDRSEPPDSTAPEETDAAGAAPPGRGSPRPDLSSRLRDFRRSLRADGPPSAPAESIDEGLAGIHVPPRLPPLPRTGFGFGNLTFDHSFEYDWSDYARSIYMAIWRAWHNRLYQTTAVFERWAVSNAFLLDHTSRVAFTIERTGQISAVTLETPSGCVPLDDSALDALREVVLPPLPADYPHASETVHARFIAEGDIRAMERHLRYLKSIDAF